jgi:hypothetical protein
MIRATALFGAVAVVVIALLAWVMTLVWPAPAARQAVLVSGVVALVVQLFAFAVVRLAPPAQSMAAWGIGVLLRLVVLMGYALVVPGAMGAPLAPALVSLVTFFFVTSLVEPLLLKR